MHCVCPNISSLPLTFVLACIQDRKQQIQHTNIENSTEKDRIFFIIIILGGEGVGCDWQARNEVFFSMVQPFWRAQMCQEEKALCEP